MRQYLKPIALCCIALLLLGAGYGPQTLPSVHRPASYPIHNAITETRGLVGYWPGVCSPGGKLLDQSGRHNSLQATQTTIAQGPDGWVQYYDGVDDSMAQKVSAQKIGTVTASMAAGVAFINDIGQDFTPYIGASGASKAYTLVATDSTGIKAWGYIGELGVGETLSPEILNAWTNISGFLYETFTVSNSDITQAVNSSGYGIAAKVLTSPQGKLYKIVNDGYTLNSGTAPIFAITDIGSNVITTLTKSAINYATALASAYQIALYTGNGVANDFSFINTSIKQVLTPTTNGVKIYSTKAGSTQSWANVATGFNANSISSYEIRKADLQITNAISAGCWVKGVPQSGKTVLSKFESTLNLRSWAMVASIEDNSKLGIWLSSDGTLTNFKRYTSSITAFDNTWHHVFFTYNNNSLKLYVDGKLDPAPTKTTDASLTTIFDSPKEVEVGCYTANWVKSGFINGIVDEVCIFNLVLPQTEIEAIYNDTKPNDPIKSTLVDSGALRIGGGSGTSFVDAIGDMSAYTGHRILISDGSKSIEGFIRGIGTGEITGSSLNQNGNIELGNTNAWNSYFNAANGASGSISADGAVYYDGNYGLNINITNDGSALADVQIWNIETDGSGFSVVSRKLYKLSFAIKANTNGNATISVVKNTSPYTNAGLTNTSSAITTDWVAKEYYFTCTNSFVQDTRIAFFFGNSGLTNVYIDDNYLQEVTAPSSSGCTIYNAESGGTQDWLRWDSGFNPNATSFTWVVY